MYKKTNQQDLSLGIFYNTNRMNSIEKKEKVTSTNPLTWLQHYH